MQCAMAKTHCGETPTGEGVGDGSIRARHHNDIDRTLIWSCLVSPLNGIDINTTTKTHLWLAIHVKECR